MKYKIIILTLIISFSAAMDYSLEDRNSSSSTYGEFVGPSYFDNMVTINYFGWENWGGWRDIFAQLCELNNNGSWDTEKAQLIGVGIASGGDDALEGMISGQGVNSPWVQDPEEIVWAEFMEGYDMYRKKVVLLDSNQERRYVFQYMLSAIEEDEVQTLLEAINLLVNEIADFELGDVNTDGAVNVLDVVAIVNHVMGIEPIDGNQYADINNDGIINVLDVVGLVNLILN